MHNFFAILKLEVYNNKPQELMKEAKKDSLLATLNVPVPDLLQEPYVSSKVRLPFKIEQIKKSGLQPLGANEKIAAYENQYSGSVCNNVRRVSYLLIQTRYISGVNAWWSSNPNKRVAEERELKDSFSIKEMKLTLKRLQRMFLYLKCLDQLKMDIFKYKYPRFSNLCFLLLTLIILMYNPAQILAVAALILLLVFVMNNPACKRVLDPFMHKYFFREELMNPYARQNVKSLSEFEEENVMQHTYSKDAEADTDEVKKAAKLKKKEGFYRSFKRIYLSLSDFFGKACDFLEKFKKYFGRDMRIVCSCGKTRRRAASCSSSSLRCSSSAISCHSAT